MMISAAIGNGVVNYTQDIFRLVDGRIKSSTAAFVYRKPKYRHQNKYCSLHDVARAEYHRAFQAL